MSKESVFKKIAEIGKSNVELKSEVVELASLSELKAQIKYLNSLEADLNKVADNYMKILSSLELAYRDANGVRNQSMNGVSDSLSIIKDFEAKVRELGIKAQDVKEYNELDSLIKETLSNIKDFDKSITKP